jgi:putative CocE/NonD family hydrolase
MAGPYSIKFEPNLPLMLRDGTFTYVDVFRPDAAGPFPGLLQRTPYDKSSPMSRVESLDAVRAAMSGYAVVIQDVRGRHSSDGEFTPFVDEMNDGHDSVEWVSSQPWCNGKVGMYGTSYVGATQWLAAKGVPPSLVCIAPGLAASDYHEGCTWQGGAFQLGFNLSWTMGLTTANWDHLANRLYLSTQLLDMLIEAKDGLAALYSYLPMNELPDLQYGIAPYYFEWLEHPEYDDYWRRVSIEETYRSITVPAYNIGGWYDIFLGGTIRNFSGMRDRGNTPNAREGQRLILGPWSHWGFSSGLTGDYTFGTRASPLYLDVQGGMLRFFDRWLKGEDRTAAEDGPVRIFVMGKNVWRNEDEWPLSRARPQRYYLHSKGGANTLRGDGWLSPEPPAEEPFDVYLYNPIDPVPTHGGAVEGELGLVFAGAFDQSQVEERQDVLVYTTPPLEQDTEVTGPVTVTLFASSTARDTDFTAKLVDVSPSGYAMNLTDGIIRARHRELRQPASLIEPDEIYEYTIDLWATSNVFKQGHRIRIEVSSSNFPRFDRNTNTGEPIGSDTRFVSVLQTVHHSSDHPSHVLLPIVPAE